MPPAALSAERAGALSRAESKRFRPERPASRGKDDATRNARGKSVILNIEEAVRKPASPGRGTAAIISRQPWDSLLPHLLKVGVDTAAAVEQLKRFTTMLIDWNSGISNLVSRNDLNRIVERHILESVEPAHWLKASGAARWIDLGSGGGLPAIPLAILGVGEHWTLVESRRNKTLFLRKVVQDLKLTNVSVVCDRIENLGGDDGLAGAFQGFTSRATMTLGPTLVLAARFVGAGGAAFLWKGSRRESEMVEDERWKAFWDFDGLLGIGAGQTVVARFVRIKNEL